MEGQSLLQHCSTCIWAAMEDNHSESSSDQPLTSDDSCTEIEAFGVPEYSGLSYDSSSCLDVLPQGGRIYSCDWVVTHFGCLAESGCNVDPLCPGPDSLGANDSLHGCAQRWV